MEPAIIIHGGSAFLTKEMKGSLRAEIQLAARRGYDVLLQVSNIRAGHRQWIVGNKYHMWPFIDLNISSLFILIYFLLYILAFSNFKFFCYHIAAMARMLSLFGNCP